MRWILYSVVGVIIATIIGGPLEARALQNPENKKDRWTSGPMRLVSKQPADLEKFNPNICAAEMVAIRTAYEAVPQKACMFGELGQFRMARYTNSSGRSYLLASYPSESIFYVVRGVCEGGVSCAYSHSTDQLIVANPGPSQYIVTKYTGVSRHLKRQFDASTMQYYYTLAPQYGAPLNTLSKRLPMNSLVVSTNGKWAAIDYMYLGVVRLNIETGEQRRILEGTSSSSGHQLSITNDGATVAAFHWNTGYKLIAVNDTCGDRITESSTGSFSRYVEYCALAQINRVEIGAVTSLSMPLFTGEYGFSLRAGAYDVTYQPSYIAHKQLNYLALGDSFTSGEGETSDAYYAKYTNMPPHSCHLSTRSYALRLQQIPSMTPLLGNAKSVACSGAVTKDILGGTNYTGQGGRNEKDSTYIHRALSEYTPGVFPQITFVELYQPGIVSVGIGGNDAGFMNKLKSCIGPGTCEWAKEGAVRQALAREIDALSGVYAQVINAIKSKAAHAEVYMIGYPQIIRDTKDAKCGALLNTLLSYEERQFIARSIERVNYVMYDAAQASGVTFVDVSSAYGEHKLCDSTATPAMNAIRLGDDFSPITTFSNLKIIGAESFHPTPYGHELVAGVIAEAFAGTKTSRRVLARSGPSVDDAYWQGDGSGEVFRYQQLSPDIAHVTPGEKYLGVVPAGTFAPGSEVTLTIQDGEIAGQALTARVDGGLSYTVHTEALRRNGVYTLYIRGATPSGESIAMYRMIAVGSDKGDPGLERLSLPGALDAKNKDTSSPRSDASKGGRAAQGTPQEPLKQDGALTPPGGESVYPKQTRPLPYLVIIGVIACGAALIIGAQCVRYARRKSKEVHNKV